MSLKGKTILITGLASTRSIAYGIARVAKSLGAELIFTYQNEKLKSRVEEIAKELHVETILECDVTNEHHLHELRDHIKLKHDNRLDGLVHSVAYAPSEQLQGSFLESLTKEGYRISHEVSAYSLCSLVKILSEPLKETQGSVVTLTYLGSERYVQNYNVMGLAKASLEASVRYLAASLGIHQVRVNAISAGPIKTLAAAGIKDFKEMLNKNAQVNLLKRNVDIDEIGKLACFLLSSDSSCLTGQVIYGDCGYSICAG